MKSKKTFLFPVFLIVLRSFIFSAPLYSPTWGFRVDLPEGYTYSGGDKKDTFSFESAFGAQFDIVVYHASAGKAAPYANVEALARDVQRRMNNKGDMDNFVYQQKEAYIMELNFSVPGAGGRPVPMTGWALCLELGIPGTNEKPPLLLAMAYGQAGRNELQPLHFSALDSIAPEEADRWAPGPVTEFSYPRETRIEAPLFGLGINARIYREDAEAAQALVDREFQVLKRYVNAPNWKEAWARFYRAIYRDSFDRLADAAFQIERKMNVPPRENRDFAGQVLQWVQSFTYERDLMGSDFVNVISAVTEGRGDCDSRAMLWAVILKQADIHSSIMVSKNFSHAMGLADLPGTGARFEVDGQKLLVAETVAKVSIGLIGETVSEVSEWLGIALE